MTDPNTIALEISLIMAEMNREKIKDSSSYRKLARLKRKIQQYKLNI